MNKGLIILIIGAVSLFCIIYFTNPVYSSGSTSDSFNTMLKSQDYKDFKENYSKTVVECDAWKVHSVTICNQAIIISYQNQLILDKLP